MGKKETNEGLTRADLIYIEEMRASEHWMHYDLVKDKVWYLAVWSWGVLVFEKEK